MGLFDKLRNAVSSNQEGNNPLVDAIVKNYFEIICGMRKTLYKPSPEDVDFYEKAKKYIEYFSGGLCDEVKLQKALELYNLSCVDITADKTISALIDFRKSLQNEQKYCIERYEASRIFCQDEIARAEIELNNVVEVIKDNVNYRHFSQGINKMQYSSAVKDIVIAKRFCAEDPVIQKLFLKYLVADFVGRLENKTYNTLYNAHDDVALLTLKALNFEKFNGTPEEYRTVTEEDYRKFILSVSYYSGVVNNNPFDKEKYISRFVKDISSRAIFYGVYASFKDCYSLSCVDAYQCDLACYLMWKAIANVCNWTNAEGDDVCESREMSDVFNIILTYLKNPDGYNELSLEESAYDGYEDEEDDEYGDNEYEDNDEYEVICPYCGTNLIVSDCDDGDEIVCAVCGREFILELNDEDDEYEDYEADVEVYNIVPDDVRASLNDIDFDDE